MTKPCEEGMRARIARFLPDAMNRALGSYETFMEQEIGDKKADFSDHHKACKAAIAHIELLIKLADWAEILGGNEQETAPVDGLLKQACEAVSGYRKTHPDDYED